MELWEIALREKGLYHIGRSKRDGAPHGSGRYPLGSGDRPYQYKEEAKAEQYRQREIGKIEKRQAKASAKSEKRSTRLASKYTDAKLKGASQEKLSRIASKYQQEKARARFDSFMAEQEKKAISKMSIEDIGKEKVAVGQQWAKSVMLTSMSLLAPVPVKVIFRPNISKMKTNRRIGGDEDKLTRGMEKAVRDSVSDTKKLAKKSTSSDKFYGYKNYNELYNAFAKTKTGRQLEKTGNQGAFENAMETWAKNKAAASDFDGGSSISKATASNRKKAQKEYEKFQKNSHKKAYTDPNSNKAYYDLELTPGNTIRASRYQSITGPDNKANLKKGERYTEYKADMKNGTAVGKKLIREATDNKGMGAKTIREEPLTEKDYKYIEDWIRKNK